MKLSGKAHCYGDHINTDVIIPARYLNDSTPEYLAQHCFEDLDADFVHQVEAGDIVIADTAEDYTVGKATEIINPSNKKILSGLHTIPCRPVMSFAPMFMGYYLNSSSFRSQIMPLIQGTKVSSIGKAQLMKTTVYIPPIDEQKRIADLLYAIDTKKLYLDFI